MSDSTELFYSEMERALAEAESAYFEARSNRDTEFNRLLFGAGFERAFKLLWKKHYNESSTTKPA